MKPIYVDEKFDVSFSCDTVIKPLKRESIVEYSQTSSSSPPSSSSPSSSSSLSSAASLSLLSALFSLCSQIYSRAARSRLTQTFSRQRRDVTCTRSLLRSERFPSASGPDNVVPHAAAAALNFTDDLVLSPRGIYDINQYIIIITAIIIIIITLVKVF